VTTRSIALLAEEQSRDTGTIRALRIDMRRNLLALVALILGCSSNPENTDNLGGPGAACSTVLGDRCGNACQSDEECGGGAYCNLGGTCSADCVGGQSCVGGGVCDGARGRCVADPNALEAGLPDGDPGTCPNVTVTFEKRVPTVVLLVDQSGSMTERFGGDTRWNVARDALVNTTTGVVKLLEKEVRFGLALYTSKDGSAGGACPLLTEVDVGLSNYASIRTRLMGASPVDETPTGESIAAVTKKLADPAIPGPKYIVLATDGEPDTCAEPNPQNGQKVAIDAAKDAFGKGIQTFYISVGSEVSASHAQQMANAGQGFDPLGTKNAKYYVASDAASMKAAFDAIIYGVRSCTFKLNAKVLDPTKGNVTLDGAKLTYNDGNGWKLSADGTEVELLGTSCEKIKSGDHSVSAQFACGAVVR
jgi:hypothetical protein